MVNQLRKTGIDVLGDIPWGTHFCHFYQTKRDFVELLTAYFKAGLENNEYCLWAISNPFNIEKVVASLEEAVPGFKEHLARKSFEILPITEWYLKAGKFKPKEIVSEWVKRLRDAQNRGFDGMRIHGNKGWLEEEDWESYQQYEKELSNSISNHRMIVLCTYPLTKVTASTFLDVVRLHSSVISTRKDEWRVLQNPDIEQIHVELKEQNKELQAHVEQRARELGETITTLENEIAERRKIHEQLIREKNLSNQIIDSMPALLLITDENLKFLRWNKNFETVTGFTAEELSSPNVIDLFFPDEATRNIPYIRAKEVLKKGALSRDEVHVFKNGQKVAFHVESRRIDYEGKPCILDIAIDITERKKAEALLKDEKKLSDEIIDSIPGLFALFDENLRFVRWNKSFETISGYTPEEILKLHGIESFFDNEEDKQRTSRILNEIFEKGSGSAEVSPLMKDGTPITLLFIGRSFQYEGKTYLITTGIDITEQKKTEAKFKTVIEQSLLGFYIISDGKFVYVNPQLAKICGYRQEELINSPVGVVIHPNDRERVAEHVRARIAGEKDTVHYEAKGLKKTGETIRIEVFCSGTLKEKNKAIMGTLLDVTDRKMAEEQLRQSESLLAEAEHLAHVGSWSLDLRNQKVTWSNELYQIFGINPSEFDHSLEKVIGFSHPEDKGLIQRVAEEAIKTRKPYNFHYRMLRPNGEERILHVRGAVMTDEQGNAVRMYGAVQDVTESKQAEEMLKQSYQQIRLLTEHLQNIREEERTHIAREIHDELGQQLTVLKMDVAWLSKKINGDNIAIKEKLNELTSLLDNTVQSVRRIASELRPSMLDDLGLGPAIEWHLNEFQKRSGIKISFLELKEELQLPAPVKTGLFRILQESLTNVAKHSKATKVQVELTENNRHLVLHIKDNGIGFDQKKVVQKKTLGILGMKERSAMMGGSYEIRSKPGKGTEIFVDIPLSSKV